MTWKKIGVKGKPVYVAEWPTFVIEIHQSHGCHEKNCRCKFLYNPFVKMRDGTHAYGIGFYPSLSVAQVMAEQEGHRLAEREAGRRVVRGNPPLVLVARDKAKLSKGGEF